MRTCPGSPTDPWEMWTTWSRATQADPPICNEKQSHQDNPGYQPNPSQPMDMRAIINKYCVKPLCFGVVCYAAIPNLYRNWYDNTILKYMVLALGLECRQRLKKIARKLLQRLENCDLCCAVIKHLVKLSPKLRQEDCKAEVHNWELVTLGCIWYNTAQRRTGEIAREFRGHRENQELASWVGKQNCFSLPDFPANKRVSNTIQPEDKDQVKDMNIKLQLGNKDHSTR